MDCIYQPANLYAWNNFVECDGTTSNKSRNPQRACTITRTMEYEPTADAKTRTRQRGLENAKTPSQHNEKTRSIYSTEK